MDSFILSSNGANDLMCNDITSDNISVISSLTVSGINILSSSNNINSFAGSTLSSLILLEPIKLILMLVQLI